MGEIGEQGISSYLALAEQIQLLTMGTRPPLFSFPSPPSKSTTLGNLGISLLGTRVDQWKSANDGTFLLFEHAQLVYLAEENPSLGNRIHIGSLRSANTFQNSSSV